MKTYLTGLLWLMMTLGRTGAQYDPEFERVLNAYIKEDGVALDDVKLRQIVADWPGSRTIDGVRSMVQELLKPTGGDRRSRTFAILQGSAVPREQIVTYLLESADAHRANPELFVRHFFLFSEYPEDERILKFLAPLLNDKGIPDPIRPPGPREERSSEARWRICDAAHGTIIQILEKRGEIKPGDPGYGDPGGEATIGKRQTNINVLESVLARAGYLDAAQVVTRPLEPLPRQAAHPQIATPKPDIATGAPKNDESRLQPAVLGGEAKPPPPSAYWFLYLLAPIVALTMIVFSILRRARS